MSEEVNRLSGLISNNGGPRHASRRTADKPRPKLERGSRELRKLTPEQKEIINKVRNHQITGADAREALKGVFKKPD